MSDLLTPEAQALLIENIKREAVAQCVSIAIQNGLSPKMLTRQQAADHFGVSVASFVGYGIPAVDAGGKGAAYRYDLRDIEAYKRRMKS